MLDNNLNWLLNWYYSQCDGDWEHGNGIQIGTIDNPGWYLKICLQETELQDKPFLKIRIDRSEYRLIVQNTTGFGVLLKMEYLKE